MPFPFTFKLSSQLSVNNPFVAGQQDAQFFQGARSPSRAKRGFGSDGDDAEDPLNLRASGGAYSASASYSHSPNYPSSAFVSPHHAPPATDRKVSRKRDRTGNTKVEPTTGLTYAQARGSGYLENAPQYSRRMQEYEGEIDDDEEELRLQEPPSKRRRGLAGSIVSTAMSAALIGTAVGLSVYRLWRDRGKEMTSPPPPDRETREIRGPPPPYTSSDPHHHHHHAHTRTPSPPQQHYYVHAKKPSKKVVGPAGGSTRRKTKRVPVPSVVVPPEFDFNSSAMDTTESGEFGENTVDDQISSLSSKLSTLIAEGQKALGREIVVAGDEDEDDDDSGAWLDVDGGDRRGRSRGGSPKKKRRASVLSANTFVASRTHSPAALSPTTAYSPRSPTTAYSPMTPRSAVGTNDDYHASTDLEEEMRKARERIMAQRGRVLAS